MVKPKKKMGRRAYKNYLKEKGRIFKKNTMKLYQEQRKNESSPAISECITIKEENTAEWEASEPSVSDPLALRQSAVGISQERTYAPRYSPSDLQNIMTDLTTASILKISDEKTFQLIDLYRNEDCLWNTNFEDYKNKEKRSLAAEKIAAILDLPNFTGKHVIMKFHNIRNMYNHELRKIAHSQAVGEPYVPRILWFSKLDSFLGPHVQRRPVESSSKKVKLLQDDTEQEQFLVTITEPASNKECSEPKKRKLPTKRTKDTKENAVRRRTENAKEDPVDIAQSLKDINLQLHLLTSSDEHDTFGKYVASLLRALPPQKALALQPQIVSLITGVGEVNEDPLDAESEQTVDIKLEVIE